MIDLPGRAALALPFRRFALVTPLTGAEVRQPVRALFVRSACVGFPTRDGLRGPDDP